MATMSKTQTRRTLKILSITEDYGPQSCKKQICKLWNRIGTFTDVSRLIAQSISIQFYLTKGILGFYEPNRLC